MCRKLTCLEVVREQFVMELTDAAVRVVAGRRLRGSVADFKLDLWRELRRVARQPVPVFRVSGGRIPEGGRRLEYLAELTRGAYHVALEHGFRGSFLDLQLELWEALRAVCLQGKFVRRLFQFLRPPTPASSDPS